MDSSRRPTDFLATSPLSFFIRAIMSGWHHTVASDEICNGVESHSYDEEYSDHGFQCMTNKLVKFGYAIAFDHSEPTI